MPPKGRPGLCISEKGSLFHFKAADEGMNAMSLIWPVMSPQKQPFGQEFFPETSLLPGVKSPAEGAALACNGGTSSPGMKGGVPGAPAAAGEFGGGGEEPPATPTKAFPLWRWGLGPQEAHHPLGQVRSLQFCL